MPIRITLIALLSLALFGCGGGGGGSSAPVVPTTATPTGVTATAKDGYILIDGNAVAGATAYNIYWATGTGVNKTTGNKLAVTSTPQAHTGLNNGTAYYYVVTAVGPNGESTISAEVSATPLAAIAATDPLLAKQWHLLNASQVSSTGTVAKANEDINVTPAWGITKGAGVRIAIVDDGLEIAHEDLASNLAPTGQSHDFVTGGSDPTNDPADLTAGHGTAVAGIVAARDLNGLGGAGVAPRATLVGYNFLQNSTSANEIDAMTLNASSVSISSNSWGATDDTGEFTPSRFSWRNAIDTGLNTGRMGKGTVYVWAAGNGGAVKDPKYPTFLMDNSNYDGRANYRGVMAVGAVNHLGVQSSYSESGANLWVAAPGGESCATHAITSVDRTGGVGLNQANTLNDYANRNYTQCMNGTSSATPMVSGVVALMLAANPNLGWRDVRIILAQTARANDFGTCSSVPAAGVPCPATNTGWFLNGTGVSSATTPRYYFNHKYGFGVVDAGAAVTAAKTWVNVGAQLTDTTALRVVPASNTIPDYVIPTTANPTPPGNAGISDTLTVTASPVSSIEWVEINFSATHAYPGDLDITLTSPSGAVSQLTLPHLCGGQAGACSTNLSAWTFGSAAHLGEAANGTWTMTVKDGLVGAAGTFNSWQLKFYGH
ncbi:MAG: S8 family serine peptidase [Sideroxydans sp.]|nr:S8 family serine peptidase [Sideroxydans sp.]